MERGTEDCFPAASDAEDARCVAEKDALKDRGWYYKEVVEKSGWQGVVDVMEAKEEDHVFHLFNPQCENAVAMLKAIVSFINNHS